MDSFIDRFFCSMATLATGYIGFSIYWESNSNFSIKFEDLSFLVSVESTLVGFICLTIILLTRVTICPAKVQLGDLKIIVIKKLNYFYNTDFIFSWTFSDEKMKNHRCFTSITGWNVKKSVRVLFWNIKSNGKYDGEDSKLRDQGLNVRIKNVQFGENYY